LWTLLAVVSVHGRLARAHGHLHALHLSGHALAGHLALLGHLTWLDHDELHILHVRRHAGMLPRLPHGLHAHAAGHHHLHATPGHWL
jgi:hypothetical protein